MTALQRAIGDVGLMSLALILAGLARRGTVRTSRAFALYLGWMFVSSVLALLWPARFYTWTFWGFLQVSFAALELAILVELVYWIFLGFPGAALSARAVVLALLIATLCAVMMIPVGDDASGPVMGALRARVQIGTAWGFAALAGLTLFYDIPVRPMHRAVMLGMTVKLVLFGEILQLLAEEERWEPILHSLQPAAFVAVACWWAWEAWRREPALTVDTELAAQLQPWRAR
jgi:hypothetical protein